MGAGAIGGFIAAALARAGTGVAVVARGAHLDVIRRKGITLVHSDLGPFTTRVEATDDVRTLGAFDAVLLTFKAHQYPELLPQLAAVAQTNATIVTLQNGVPFWFVRTPALESVDPGGRIGALFADERVVGGVVHVSGHIVEPGKIHQSGGTRYAFGAPPGGTNERVAALIAAFASAELAPEVDTNIRGTVWLKLVNNVGLNPISTLHELTIRQMLERSSTRDEVRMLMEEALAVGQALGVVAHVDIEARLAYAQRLADVRTSMLQDYQAGRALEAASDSRRGHRSRRATRRAGSARARRVRSSALAVGCNRVSVRVLAAGLDEYEAGIELRAEMSRDSHEAAPWDEIDPGWRERFREFFTSRQALGRAQLFLAYDGAQAIGMSITYIGEHYRTAVFGRTYAMLHGVFVKPAYRRRGIARALTQAAIDWARERGCYSVRLHSSDMGMPLYRSLGFETTSDMELRLQ